MAVIAFFKLVKGCLLLAAAIGLLRMVLHGNLSTQIEHLILALRLDPDSHYLHALLQKVAGLDPQKLHAIGVGSFFYSALLLVEGVGLWFEWRWAEFLTVIGTASFIPFELYELFRHFTGIKVVVLLINVGILWYVWRMIRSNNATRKL